MNRLTPIRFAVAIVAVALAAVAPAWAGTARLLILHTNDLHDHVRPGFNGVGGLPYVSGYVRQVRSERSDVLLLDGGDVAEKGDLVAFRTHSEMTYEALSRIGYDAVTIGNHEYDEAGVEGLRRYEQILGKPLLCLNLTNASGSPEFERSRIVEVNGVRVGIVGLLTPRKVGGLDFPGSAQALAREAASLRADGAHLVVAVCHETAENCAEWSRLAPDVNVFVSGHSHQALERPVVVPETGAIVVQAGNYARWVGRLELVVDTEARQVVAHEGSLVPMRHADVPVDADMLAWVQKLERELAPEAGELVFENPAEINGYSVGRLAAEALRLAAGTDVAFCHPNQIIRDVLPAGPIDVNAVFKTGGHRGHVSVLLDLSGAEIEAYLNALQFIQREPPEWAGFRVSRETNPDGSGRLRTELEAPRRYRVIMAKLEWETRFLRLAAKIRERDPANPLAQCQARPEPTSVNFTDALRGYLKTVIAEGVDVQARADELSARRQL